VRSLLKACGAALLLAGYAAGQPQVAARGEAARGEAAPSRAAVQAAVEELRRDPNLGRTKTIKSLHWVEGPAAPTLYEPPSWIVGLFQFLSQAAGVLLWVAGGIGLAIAAIWVYRVVKARRSGQRVPAGTTVSHVQDLDIRPASLPADVGAAALELLGAGRTREALSLLYRGALSRAVHNFSVVIGESYTEGEALRAVNQRLDRVRVQYFSTLVGLWQRTVYAGDIPAAEPVATLCREFSPVLGGTPI
jgi:hypothetical protein